jgi:hypothetical protein
MSEIQYYVIPYVIMFQAAEAIGTAASKLSSDLPADTRQELCSLLLSGLSGRTYTGKEIVLKATASFAASCR